MNLAGQHAGYFPPELERDLVELMKLHKAFTLEPGITMVPSARFPGEDKIGDWLKKAGEIVSKYHPKSYTIGIGIPFGAQLSFSWEA